MGQIHNHQHRQRVINYWQVLDCHSNPGDQQKAQDNCPDHARFRHMDTAISQVYIRNQKVAADCEHNAAGALKYVEYDYFKRWMMKRIAEEEDGPTDTSRDHELTDWPALDEFVDAFVNCANSR